MGRKKKLPDQIEAGIEVFPSPDYVPLAARIERIKVEDNPDRAMIMDLRIHTPSSLAHMKVEGVDTAPALVRIAKVKRLDIIAITDFHSGSSIDAVVRAAAESNLKVIPGVTLRCSLPPCDDVTLIVLFPEQFASAQVDTFLNNLGVPQDRKGDATYIVTTPFKEVVSLIEVHGGIAIPTRLDRTPQQRQIIPRLVEEYGFKAFDLAHEESAEFFSQRWPKQKFRLFSFSNANVLAQVGSRIGKIRMDEPGFLGIKQAIERRKV
jgi:hypothetical protein